jgi:Tfp pilus assembly protein PilZ
MNQNKSGSPEKERRKHPRIKVQIWAVEVDDNSRYFHLLTNLSMGGFFIEKKLPFKVGSIVNLELELGGEILPLRGKIINNYKNPDNNFFGAGILFQDMDEEVKGKIEAYLRKLEKEDQEIK